jgi:hypothetical protein
MALTEEEKKKKMQQDISLDEWYNTNQQNIERQAQQQYEDAYVNRELMNKYLNQNLASQGLADTGIANLYAQQANTDYMNQRANIANAQQEAETNLFNQYYSEKKAEHDREQTDLKAIAEAGISKYLGTDGRLDDAGLDSYNQWLGTLGLDESNMSYMNNLSNTYLRTDAQQTSYNQSQKENELSYSVYDALRRDPSSESIEAQRQIIEQAYQNGEISQQGYIGFMEKLDEADATNKSHSYAEAYINFDAELGELFDDNGKLTAAEKEQMLEKLEDKRSQLGEEYYNQLKSKIIASTETSVDIDKKQFAKMYPNTDPNNFVDADGASPSSFGDWIGVGKGKEQDQYVQNIIDEAQKAKNGEPSILKDGDIVDFNYGASTMSDRSLYRYYKGKFYKVTGLYPTDANITSKQGYLKDSTIPTVRRLQDGISGAAKGIK